MTAGTGRTDLRSLAAELAGEYDYVTLDPNEKFTAYIHQYQAAGLAQKIVDLVETLQDEAVEAVAEAWDATRPGPSTPSMFMREHVRSER